MYGLVTIMNLVDFLGQSPRRRRFTGAERGSRGSQGNLNRPGGRVRATEHAPRGPHCLIERRLGLAEIVERRTSVIAERIGVNLLHRERESIILSENTARDWDSFAQQ